MAAKQKAVVPWQTGFTFEDEASKQISETWYWMLSRNSEYKGKESKLQKVAHRLGEEGITFQSVRGKTLTTEELLSAAFSSPPKLGIKSCMLRVLKEVEEGETFG